MLSGRREFGVKFDGLAIFGGCLLPLALVVQDDGEAVVRRGVLRVEFNGLAELGGRLFLLPLVVQRVAEAGVRPASLGSSSMALRYSDADSSRLPWS